MLRRSLRCLYFQVPDRDMTPSNAYGPHGWNYNLSQGMPAPRTINRTMSAPTQKTFANPNRYPSVYIPLEGMHPTFRVALEPYLRKLAMTNVLPTTSASDAVADYERIAPNILEDSSRLAWLAKVIQLCAIQRKHDLSQRLWELEKCQSRFVDGNEVPPSALIQAMLFSACKGKSPDAKVLFECSQKNKWNLSPQFGVRLWDHLLKCAGRMQDENFVVELWKEAIDVHANTDAFDRKAWVLALNAIKSPANYQFMKDNLFKLSAARVSSLAKMYVNLRSDPSLSGKFAMGFEMPENDNVYYHVLWHDRIRKPMHFCPRQLFFDYKPSLFVSDSKQKSGDIVKQRIEKWKEEGLLPQDYEPAVEFQDRETIFKKWTRGQKWKTKPKWMDDPKRWKQGSKYYNSY